MGFVAWISLLPDLTDMLVDAPLARFDIVVTGRMYSFEIAWEGFSKTWLFRCSGRPSFTRLVSVPIIGEVSAGCRATLVAETLLGLPCLSRLASLEALAMRGRTEPEHTRTDLRLLKYSVPASPPTRSSTPDRMRPQDRHESSGSRGVKPFLKRPA